MSTMGAGPKPAIEDDGHAFHATDQRYSSIALRHVKPEHVRDALNHYARSLAKAVSDGRMRAEELDALPDHVVNAHLASIAKQNPHIAAPRPPPKRRAW